MTNTPRSIEVARELAPDGATYALMSPPNARAISQRSIAAFYVLALGLSWALWAPWVASVQVGGSRTSWRYLHLLGSLGPCVAGLFILRWTGGRGRVREFLRGTATLRAARVAILWGVLFPAAIFVVSTLIMGRANHATVHWDRLGIVPEYPALGPLQYMAASLLFYGIGEEVGWRGVLYPALRKSGRRVVIAALLVVPFWALWHLPLFFATDSYRAMGLGGAAGWLLSLASGSILTVWLYDRANGSVLPAVVLHAVLDVFFLADVGVPVQSAMGAMVTVWGIAVAIKQIGRRAEGETVKSPPIGQLPPPRLPAP